MSAGARLRRRTAHAGRPSPRSHPGRREGGAAAVEFALVTPLLLTLLFGIIDYGIWFADSIAVRQGVREAARSGVVGRFDATCTPLRAPGADADFRKLACTAANGTTVNGGQLYVRIRAFGPLPAGSTAALGTENQWGYGGTLRVCVMERHNAILPLVPLPGGGIIRSRVDMAVENAPVTPVTKIGGQDAPPAGADWSWC